MESETRKHQQTVSKYINVFIKDLLNRSENHDKSKLNSPEKEIFEEFTHKLKSSTYGSEEYNQFLKDMKPALDHHYAKNRHHPEHYGDRKIDGMTLIDLLEMFSDWLGAVERHENGNILKSIEINKSRFNISNQLEQILINTVKFYNFDKPKEIDLSETIEELKKQFPTFIFLNGQKDEHRYSDMDRYAIFVKNVKDGEYENFMNYVMKNIYEKFYDKNYEIPHIHTVDRD